MAQPAAKSAPKKRPSSPLATGYLVVYNTACAILRTFIVVRTFQLWSSGGNAAVWQELNLWAKWAETLATIEIVHAAAGLVRAAPLTTALQTSGRSTIVWAITRNYPDVATREWAYTSMLAAWNAADAVRYTYFAIERATGNVPSFLLWLKYNLFIVLYPVGFLSEAWLVYNVIEPSQARQSWYQYLLWFGLSLYPPSSYILYGHMLRQRSKFQRQKKD